MWKFALFVVVCASVAVHGQYRGPSTGSQLVSSVLNNCIDVDCVKRSVLGYLDNVLQLPGDSARSAKDVDAAIFKRAARILKTHEFKLKLPEMLFDRTQLVYNPRTGLDITDVNTESRGLLKKKVLFPLLLLFKLKMKLLMPIVMGLIGLKAFKALILSKLAIGIVLGFLIYQLCVKAGMSMPMSMSMASADPPISIYGPPSTTTPDSYDPSWVPNQGGPYSRIWSPSNDAQSLAYSGYYSNSGSSTTQTSLH